jgi:xanthosine phosphorylase
MAGAWDSDARATLTEAAIDVGEPITTGVYAWWLGPTFETPAEIQLLAQLGANAVGMSTVPDCIIARHCGLRVVGLAAITNFAEGMSPVPISHAQTLAGAKLAGDRLRRIVTRFLERFDG